MRAAESADDDLTFLSLPSARTVCPLSKLDVLRADVQALPLCRIASAWNNPWDKTFDLQSCTLLLLRLVRFGRFAERTFLNSVYLNLLVVQVSMGMAGLTSDGFSWRNDVVEFALRTEHQG
eukprot:COSAG01_NODE_679_length_14296_cov_250.437575_10_plen_121_part_00